MSGLGGPNPVSAMHTPRARHSRPKATTQRAQRSGSSAKKAAMNMLGLGGGSLRLPLYEMSDAAKAKLQAALSEVGAL